ncbi:Cyclophilin-like peptidyl-prolyl cis-trans isomerase domain [Pseudocohnilembus persalinus]|uniref:fructose-bisphosphatase n=1 Tax=Pseudocohnilembus persalinus TaxID=266149 RepID=A0A0V0QEI3_PSEPJ|nr:Cyclophilin-like peptidyl-prolyl cis-trans isomerase domain [Pseudocohnilembus persalinus]|eukprot:KRX00613.1 Cyclophilin-like peptidyl-prolyl cis-trans isomerase domain [Pseudocohnilembus persalinus]
MVDDPNYQQMKIIVQDLENQKNKSSFLNSLRKNSLYQKNILLNEKNYKADYDINKKNLKKSLDKNFVDSIFPKIKLQKQVQKQERPAFITVNNKKTYFSLKDFAESEYRQINYADLEKKYQLNQFQKFSKKQQETLFQETKSRKFCFLDFKDIINKKTFRLVFELYWDIAPLACENFLSLCQGFRDRAGEKKSKIFSYKGQKIQRFRRYFFLQGGFFPDFKSVFGGYFRDESYQVKHNVPGILGCANQGKPHTNSSSFYVTMEEMEGLDKKGVAFGRVVEGLKELQKLNKNLNDQNFDLQIIDCGKFYYDTHINRPLSSFEDEVFQDIKSLKSLSSDGVEASDVKSIKIDCNNQVKSKTSNIIKVNGLSDVKQKSSQNFNIVKTQSQQQQQQQKQQLLQIQSPQQQQQQKQPIVYSRKSMYQQQQCKQNNNQNLLEAKHVNIMNMSSSSNQQNRSPIIFKKRSSMMSSSYKSKKSSLSPLKRHNNNKKNFERKLSYESLITEIQEIEQEEQQIIQKRKELFNFSHYQHLKENKSHQQHLEQYSEKFSLGSDFVDLMQSVEKGAIEIRKILQKAYKFQKMEDLVEEISEKLEENFIESGALSLIYNIKKNTSTKVPQSQSGRFIIAYNPIDVNSLNDVSQCGFLFIVFKKTTSAYRPATMNDFSQLGEKIDCAGYCIFGPNTQLVYHAGFRVNVYNFDKKEKKFNLSYNNVKAPKKKGILTLDTSKISDFSYNLQLFYQRKSELMHENQDTYYQRFSKSLSTDFHRTLLHGGILLLPKIQNPNSAEIGGLNFLEAQIFSYLIDKAWEISSTGEGGSILFKKCEDLQERSALFLGCGSEIQELENIFLNIRRQGSVIKILQDRSSVRE